MTPQQLQDKAKELYPYNPNNTIGKNRDNSLSGAAFIQGATFGHQSRDAEIKALKKLCEMAGVPALLIEHPEMFDGTPSPETIEWAEKVIAKHESKQ
jgi:hypothetical protein